MAKLEKRALTAESAGACVCFEGWVRNANDGRDVRRLDYQAFESLALSEGERILAEATQRFGLCAASAVHRTGSLGDRRTCRVGWRERGTSRCRLCCLPLDHRRDQAACSNMEE
jgi:molybdopterin synthase catalytic subunit